MLCITLVALGLVSESPSEQEHERQTIFFIKFFCSLLSDLLELSLTRIFGSLASSVNKHYGIKVV